MVIKVKGKEFDLRDTIEDVMDEYFGEDDDFAFHFALAMEDFLKRKVDSNGKH